MKTPFTPGPWRHDDDLLFPEEWYADATISAHGKLLGAAMTSPEGFGLTEAKANARLIATAPELLEALEHFLGRMELSGEWDDGCFYYARVAAPELQEVILKARKVVNKARGA